MDKKKTQSRARSRSHAKRVSWNPADGEAASPLSDFQIPAQDSHGHSTKVISRITPSMQRQISVIVEKNPFGWDTASDFVRWAIYHGQQKVTEHLGDPEISSTMALISSWVAAARVQQEHVKFSNSLEHISGTLAELRQHGADIAARKIVEEILSQIDGIDDPYWKKRFEEEIEGKFGSLLVKEKEKEKNKKKGNGR